MGDFPDWSERMPTESRASMVAAGLLRSSATTGLAGENPTVDHAHVPRQLQLETTRRHPRRAGIADAFMTVNRITVVSKRVADLIEAVDPGRHQLFKIEALTTYDGRPLEEAETHGPYFILNVRPVQEAMDMTQLGYGPRSPNFPDYYALNPRSNIVLRAERLDPDIDMWRECYVSGIDIFISDRLAAELDERAITFFTKIPTRIA